MAEREIGRDTVVCWSGAPVATEVNDEVVLMNLDRDRCYGLGATGSDLGRRMKIPVPVSELCLQLRAEYDAEPGQIEAEVLKTLRQFADEGLIEVRD
jgi:hypothetical protein